MGFCFNKLLQDDLDAVKDHWNTHRIRHFRHDTVSGRPDELFFLPELHGGADNLLCNVCPSSVESLKENLTYEERSVQQEYFEYVIMANIQLEMPNNCEEGIQLYQTLLDIAGVNE